MVKSMTGFGRYELIDGHRKVSVEMKSVNHRYNEISIRLPRKLNFYEAAVRNILKEYISRGKVDVFISYIDTESNEGTVDYNAGLAKGYIDCIRKISDDFSLPTDFDALAIARMPEVITVEDESLEEDEICALVERALRGCCEKFVETRVIEGEKLKEDILQKLDGISSMVDRIVERSPKIVEEYRNKIYEKVKELIGDTTVSESVLATELIVFSDKICTDEEMVRLKAHVSNMKSTLESGKDVGRKLDFVAQEMNREANTTLSKSNDMETSNIAIDLKTEIEKIREQIQNIE